LDAVINQFVTEINRGGLCRQVTILLHGFISFQPFNQSLAIASATVPLHGQLSHLPNSLSAHALAINQFLTKINLTEVPVLFFW